MRLLGLGQDALWLDEANTWAIAREPLGGIVQRLQQDASPPLYYFFLHGWMAWFGESAWVLRLPSVLAGVALVALTFHVGRSFFSQRAGFVAAWLVAVSPSQIFHSQEARMYSWLGWLALLATWRLVRALSVTATPPPHGRSEEVRAWAFYALALAAALLTHNFAFHLVPAHACIVLASARPARGLAAFAAAGLLTLALYAPWLPVFLGQLRGVDTYSWYADVWATTGPLKALLRSLDSISPFGQYFAATKVPPVRWLQVIAGAVLLLSGIGARVEGRRARSAVRFPVTIAFALPVLTSIALSVWLTPHFVPGRVDQMMLAPLMLLVGAGFESVCPRGKGGGVLAIAAALITLGAGLYLRPVDEADLARRASAKGSALGTEAAVFESLMDRARPGDLLICTSLARAPLVHLLHLRGMALRVESFPASTAEHLGGQDDRLLLEDRPALAREAEAVVDRALGFLSDEAPSARRVHLVLMESEVNRILGDRFEAAELAGRIVPSHLPAGFIQRAVHQFGTLRSYVRE
ncbi:hypothetical protein Poly30_47340 [Planctomycetes bacterium Poly30]|uniref:Glycosyltransferase RgtA/B/C/D-like domain-containing protein n=1 Tax=Saltatorellus ferox TaxID=2528018 RepID=A0A518EYL3_9BACT|nr:hypothetical protein Poly30_47340 [Planctomycetes bacterium Poly30]